MRASVAILVSAIALALSAPAFAKCNPCDLSDSGLNLIKQFEGYSPYPYKDTAGLWTIGFGHLMIDGEVLDVPLLGEAAEELLRRDATKAVSAVNRYTSIALVSDQFSALVSFTFNLGEGAYKTSTLRKRVNAERHEDVPTQLLRWVYSGGKYTRGLARRRCTEGLWYEGRGWKAALYCALG